MQWYQLQSVPLLTLYPDLRVRRGTDQRRACSATEHGDWGQSSGMTGDRDGASSCGPRGVPWHDRCPLLAVRSGAVDVRAAWLAGMRAARYYRASVSVRETRDFGWLPGCCWA